ncbi:MAG: M16 family metallopeptidase [Planctomycetaceae bacterium]
MRFHEARLPNGLQIIGEASPSVHSVALGFFVRTGSRDETDQLAGVSHFLEHMVFKGTERHSADDVNRIFDEVGADYNASTSEETTLFYAAVLPEYLGETFELLADILFPSLRTADFDREKKGMLEEIGMYDDQPTYLAYDQLMTTHFRGHPLGRCVLGTRETVEALTADQMREYHARRYTAGNILLAVAGRFDWQQVLDLAARHCGHWRAGDPPRDIAEARPQGGRQALVRPTIGQQHVMTMSPAPSAQDPQRYAADLLSVIVGDDTGSRLFWELVDPGHAESADLGFQEFDGSGAYLCYFACNPEDIAANRARVQAIFDDLNRNGVTEAELSQARNKVASRIVLRSERPMGRLGSLGHNWQYCHEYRPVAAELDTVAKITTADIRALLDRYPLAMQTTSTVGPDDDAG